MNTFERLCNIFGFLPIHFKDPKLEKAIKFCNLNVTTKQVYSLSIMLPFILIVIGFFLSFFIPLAIVIVYWALCFLLGYYLLTYPFSLQRNLRIRLSSEIVTAVLYMATYLRENPNLEKAVEFAALNLTGPLGLEFKKIVWDVYEGKYLSMEEALSKYSEKWKEVSEEFVEALDLIKNYSRRGALDEAVSVILEGTREKMKEFSFQLRNPVRLIDVLGFTLPLIAMTLAPIILILRPFAGAPAILISAYCIFLPVLLYWQIKSTLEKRPWTFSIVDISEHSEAVPKGKLKIKGVLLPVLPISILIGFLVASPGIFYLLNPKPFSFKNVIYTLSITWGIALALFIYFYSFKQNVKIIEEIKKSEREFSEAIYILADKLAAGTPLETSLEKTSKTISHLSLSELFEKILYNVKNLGMTLEKALFDKDAGAIRYCPSRMIKSVFKVLVDAVKKGVKNAAQTASAIARHLKLAHATEQDVRDVTEEAGSSMRIECLLLAPLTCGVIVAFASIAMEMIMFLGEMFQAFLKGFTGPTGMVGESVFLLFQNITEIITPEYFQIIVGIYLIEAIYLLSMFQSKLENGEDEYIKNSLIGSNLLLGCLIYTVVLVLTVVVFSILLPITALRL
jgi:Flp pilus assembly protein TadB